MRICLSFLAMTNTAPLSLPFWPIFQASATRSEYSSMVSGLVVGTIRTASWLVVRASQSASLASNAWRSPAASVPVMSVTRAESTGTGCSPSRGGSHATALTAPGSKTSASTHSVSRIIGPSVFGRTTLDSRNPAPAKAGGGNDENSSVPPRCREDIDSGQPRYFPAGAGAGAGLLKSTVGGTLMPFSFSTEKFGLTFILNTIAVRLVGSERTVVLYSCTDLM